ncbi:1-acyl-sn-glycerol-3-phosphate acyltransferase [Gammaproteobacteria bacterium]|nr:1-acyl-sn-glycerol-3-phosphate acyltransferase [Gammaproteobacteria bacterium]
MNFKLNFKYFIKIIFFMFFVKPVVFIALGLNIRGRLNLPKEGPVIIAANHTSHLDALVLMSLFPLADLHKVRPVAAADYFMKNKWIAWFSVYCLDIIPFNRFDAASKSTLFKTCYEALDKDQIIILFPKGTRSSNAQDSISKLKRGVFHLVKDRPKTKIIPVLLHGLGKSLPKGTALFVPFNCDVMIDNILVIKPNEDAHLSIKRLEDRYQALLEMCVTS